MNILRVISSMDPIFGGPSQGIRNSVLEFQKQGINNEVVCLDHASKPFLQQERFVVHALNHNGPWYYSGKLIPWLITNACRFDVIIVHGIWLYHSYAVGRAVGLLKKGTLTKIPKVFIMPHGMLDPFFQEDPNRKFKAFRNWVYWKLLEGKVLNAADGVLFTCEEELLLARRTFKPYLPKKEINIGYGISKPPEFCERMKEAFFANCKKLVDQPYFLFLSRIHRKKGLKNLLAAYQDILANTSVMSFPTLVIAGPGWDSPYGSQIRTMVSKSDILSKSVILLDMLSGDEKWGAFYCCDAFILPSHQENFGIAIVEAMACEKSVLISDKINIWREIVNSHSGLVETDTIGGTRELMIRWNNLTISEKKTMRKNAMECFIKQFSIDSTTYNMLNAIKG